MTHEEELHMRLRSTTVVRKMLAHRVGKKYGWESPEYARAEDNIMPPWHGEDPTPKLEEHKQLLKLTRK